MPGYCCVPDCKSNKGGHLFPTIVQEALKWRVAIRRSDPNTKRLWVPNLSYDVVCADHFKANDYKRLKPKRLLKVGAIPSVFKHWTKTQQPRVTGAWRSLPALNTGNEATGPAPPTDNARDEGPDSQDFESDVISCHSFLTKRKFSIANFQEDSKALQYFTGFDDIKQFSLFRDLVTYNISLLDYSCTLLSDEDQLFLTPIKLRQSLDHQLLAYLFNISETTVSKIFSSWINYIYLNLKQLDIWPPKKVIVETMPEDFKKLYPSTRVIIDSTEIPIEKPSNIRAQAETFSTYKNRNTIKVLIGITPKGAVSYISDCFGGAASDRSMIENSDLLKNVETMFERGDVIMGDKGFLCQDLFAPYDVAINTPTFMKGRSRLTEAQRLSDVTISSKRVQVERIIGYAKSFKIIHGVIPYNLLPLSNKIVFICFSLVNFRNTIC